MTNDFRLKAEDRTIEDILFSTNEKYELPRFQRQYTWSPDQADEFWQDLIGEDSVPFLGSFIFNLENKAKTGYVEVVDGQQRLLTITILLAAIRDVLTEIGDKDYAQRIQSQRIAFQDTRSGKYTFRVKPGDTLRDFFEAFIQDKPDEKAHDKVLRKEQKLVLDNYFHFRTLIADLVNRKETSLDKKGIIDELLSKIEEIKIIRIDIYSDEDAYTVFESVNARGVELSVADLLKNLIFKHLKPTEGSVDLAKKKWQEIEDNIFASSLNMPTFLRHYWLSRHGHTSEKKLYKEIKRVVDTENIEGFLEDILDASRWYSLIDSGSREDWEPIDKGIKIYKTLLGIRAMGVTQCYVIFLAILQNLERLSFDPTTYFESVEKFSFKYSAISKQQANKAEKLYSKNAVELWKVLPTSKKLNKKDAIAAQRKLDLLIQELRRLSPTKSLFKENFMELSYKKSSKSRLLLKYVLSKTNFYLGQKEFELNFDQVNLEHILPQKPEEEWGLTEGEIAGYVNLIGNLTLVHKEINSRAGNKNLKVKSKHLEESDIRITKLLVEQIKDSKYVWNEKTIRERQAWLAEVAYDKIWVM
ncbi:MAG: DUF262 domain-containing HNH endonuclease family protein [Candidatus Colwellbacteria bacterium]